MVARCDLAPSANHRSFTSDKRQGCVDLEKRCLLRSDREPTPLVSAVAGARGSLIVSDSCEKSMLPSAVQIFVSFAKQCSRFGLLVTAPRAHRRQRIAKILGTECPND